MKIVDIGTAEKPVMTKTQVKEAITAFNCIAEINWNYFKALKEQGFTEDQALDIVKNYKFT